MKVILSIIFFSLLSCGNKKTNEIKKQFESPKYYEFSSSPYVQDFFYNAPENGTLEMFKYKASTDTVEKIDHSHSYYTKITGVDFLKKDTLVYYRLYGTIWELDTVTNSTQLKIIGQDPILNHFFIDNKYYYVERSTFYKKLIEYDLVNEVKVSEYNIGQSYHIGKIKIEKYNDSLFVVNDKIYEVNLLTKQISNKSFKNTNDDLVIQDAIIAVDKIVYQGRLNNGYVIATYDIVSDLYSYVYQNNFQVYTKLTRRNNKVFYYYSDNQNRLRIKYINLNDNSDNSLLNAWTDGYVSVNSNPAKPIVVGDWLYYITTSGLNRLKKYNTMTNMVFDEMGVNIGSNPSLGFSKTSLVKGFISYSDGANKGNGLIVTDTGLVNKFYATDNYKISPLVLTNNGVMVKEENLTNGAYSLKVLNEDFTYQMLSNNLGNIASSHEQQVFVFNTDVLL